jgi:hypothetical protein
MAFYDRIDTAFRACFMVDQCQDTTEILSLCWLSIHTDIPAEAFLCTPQLSH